MIRRIDYLHTPTSLPRETGMLRLVSTCVPGGIWLMSMACKCLAGRGLPGYTLYDVCNQYSLTGMGSVRSADLYIFTEEGSVRSASSAHVYRWV